MTAPDGQMNAIGDRFPIDLCPTCQWVDAHGPDEADTDWPGFTDFWVPGKYLWSEVNCGFEHVDDLRCDGHYVRPGFACDGCGDTLGGDRYCYVAVRVRL